MSLHFKKDKEQTKLKMNQRKIKVEISEVETEI